MVPSSSINKELPSGRPACPANRASTVGVPVDVVRRESRGEGRVPGMIGWWVLEVVNDEVEMEVGEGDDERGRFRLRKDIWCLCMVKKGCMLLCRKYSRASAIDYVITLSSGLAFSVSARSGSRKQSVSIYEISLHYFCPLMIINIYSRTR